MADTEAMINWYKRERARLRRYLDELEAGRATTQARRGLDSPIVDTTQETIADMRRALAEVHAILEHHPDA